MKSKCGFLAAFVTCLWCGLARADVDAAKAYVKEAQDLISMSDYSGASAKLELAEAELEGVDAAAKAPVESMIADVKSKITGANAAVNKSKYDRQLKNVMDDAEHAIGNMATWAGAEAEANELFANPEAQAALGADLETAKKKFATFKKLNDKKFAVEYGAQAEQAVIGVEEEWIKAKPLFADPDASPNSKSSAIEDTQRSIARARETVAKLPADDPKTTSLTARLDKIGAEFSQVALADKAKEVAETLQRQIDLYKDDFDGWDKETTAPSWAAYQKESSAKMSAFMAPRTREYISRTDNFLENLEQNEDYKSVASAPAVKAIVDKARQDRALAYKKMVSFVTPVVVDAEKSPTFDDSTFGKLKDDVRFALGEKSPEGLALQERIEKKLNAAQTAAAGAAAGQADQITMLRAKAEQAWPTLSEGLGVTPGADFTDLPSLKGKTVSFTADNLMGYRFKPGDFYFATTLAGTPVAAKIPADLMAGIKATEAAIGRSIGDDDGDGRWELVCTITDRHTKLLAKRSAEGTGTVDGMDVKVTTEYAEPVEATIIEFVAAKCGPFAGATGKGVLKPDGNVGK